VFATFGRSWELAKSSLSVLRSDKELLLFPLVSFIGLVLVSIGFAIPWFALGGVNQIQDGQVNIVSLVLAFLYYLVAYTVTFFFQTALVAAAMIRLDGGDPTLGDGFRAATSRLPQILGYAVIAATVGMILRWISERAGLVGAIIIGIIGFAWNLATFLVVPVLVMENLGPIDAIKRSGSLLRKTWGEQLIGAGGIGLVFGLLFFVVVMIGAGLIVAVSSSTTLVIVVLIAVFIVAGLIGLIGSAASGVYTASLYRYATKGDPGTAFSADTIAGAFRSNSVAPINPTPGAGQSF
jgi:Family of unknown function (DUF6159)